LLGFPGQSRAFAQRAPRRALDLSLRLNTKNFFVAFLTAGVIARRLGRSFVLVLLLTGRAQAGGFLVGNGEIIGGLEQLNCPDHVEIPLDAHNSPVPWLGKDQSCEAGTAPEQVGAKQCWQFRGGAVWLNLQKASIFSRAFPNASLDMLACDYLDNKRKPHRQLGFVPDLGTYYKLTRFAPAGACNVNEDRTGFVCH
jgi:hypothetical protein